MEEFFTPTLSHQMRLYPRQNHHTPTDAILILDLEDGSTSRFPVHKLILAAQSEFFEGLFTLIISLVGMFLLNMEICAWVKNLYQALDRRRGLEPIC